MAGTKPSIKIAVSEDVKWKLRALALEEKKTLSVFVRDALQHYIDSKGISLNLSEGLDGWGGNRREDESGADE